MHGSEAVKEFSLTSQVLGRLADIYRLTVWTGLVILFENKQPVGIFPERLFEHVARSVVPAHQIFLSCKKNIFVFTYSILDQIFTLFSFAKEH
jgi:hypothetical protein